MAPAIHPWDVIRQRLHFTDVGCWEWTGALAKGYGQIKVNGQRHKVHRLVYEHHVGVIPEGLEIDHLCKNKACCNPQHLEAVTHRENLRRGDSPIGLRARQTHCDNGHEYTPENTRMRGTVRCCITCLRRRKKEYRTRRRQRA